MRYNSIIPVYDRNPAAMASFMAYGTRKLHNIGIICHFSLMRSFNCLVTSHRCRGLRTPHLQKPTKAHSCSTLSVDYYLG
jgi:hypothetical protein